MLRTLQSLYDTTAHLDTEYIVVIDEDEKSRDIARDWLYSNVWPNFELVFNEKRVGALNAWNQAAALAKGHYLFALGDDQVCWPGWLDTAIEAHQEQLGGYGVVGLNDLIHEPIPSAADLQAMIPVLVAGITGLSDTAVELATSISCLKDFMCEIVPDVIELEKQVHEFSKKLVALNDFVHEPMPDWMPVVCTTMLFDRQFCKDVLGGVVAYACYKYLFVDAEIDHRARQSKRLIWRRDAIVEHMHAAIGKREQDQGDLEHSDTWIHDEAMFKQREMAGFPNDFECVVK